MSAQTPWLPPPGSSASSAGNRKSMLGNRRRDTKPELAVRRLLHAAGYRYRVDHRPLSDLRRTADIVFTRAHVAVFIDGCYWHGCELHTKPPKTNPDYWVPKIERNRERDAETDAALAAEGWTVIRVWEHDDPDEVAKIVQRAVDAR